MDVADAINIMLYASPRARKDPKPPNGVNEEGISGNDDKEPTGTHATEGDRMDIDHIEKTTEDEQPGCAVWDLFRAEDADKIRSFLKGKYGGKITFTDPIHSQIFYLDSDLRKELAEEYGVVSFRVYQYPVSRCCVTSYHTLIRIAHNMEDIIFVTDGTWIRS